MKYLVIALAALMLSGCARPSAVRGFVITEIEMNGPLCFYKAKGVHQRLGENSDDKLMFWDYCGKFTVGDTIYITK